MCMEGKRVNEIEIVLENLGHVFSLCSQALHTYCGQEISGEPVDNWDRSRGKYIECILRSSSREFFVL